MKNNKVNLKETLKQEVVNLLIILIGLIIVFKVVFYKEDFFVVVRTVISLFWLFAIPGFFIMLLWINELDFLERLIGGIVVGMAVVGILSYYLVVFGLHVKYHWFFVPLLVDICATSMIYYKLFKKN